MHEMSLACELSDLIENTARQHNAKQVTEFTLEIGQLSGVETESLLFCLESALSGGIAARAAVKIIEKTGRGTCVQCHHRLNLQDYYTICPKCGHYEIQITSGREFKLQSVELI
ncbi:MAG TPA: hydrogenase maturation nickel metallochaperone HypA [Gammaproteobacteria bacterium]|nr:hydrogenase maturation nickel metallochaperone HypA [Gammaproteobacteria bacterium]